VNVLVYRFRHGVEATYIGFYPRYTLIKQQTTYIGTIYFIVLLSAVDVIRCFLKYKSSECYTNTEKHGYTRTVNNEKYVKLSIINLGVVGEVT